MPEEKEETTEGTQARPTITIAERQSGDSESKPTITIAEKKESDKKP